MKATILADGMLSIAPESELEAYALGRWSNENIRDDWYAAAHPAAPKIIIDLSEYAARAGISVTIREVPL